MDVRFICCGAISVFLAFALSNPSRSQDPAAVQPQDQFFAGIITALSSTSVTVTRTVLGKDATVRTFAITAERCAEDIARGVERDARTVLTPRSGWLFVAAARLLPGPVQRVMSKMNRSV